MSSIHVNYTSPVLVLEPTTCAELLAQRREMGGDRYDEVWQGVYVMSPWPGIEHQRIVGKLTVILSEVVESLSDGVVFPGANVTDRLDDWEFNFRCPDVVVVLDESRLTSLEAAIVGGPEFLVEVISPGDRWKEKLEFYASIGVRELLIVDRDTKHLELYRNVGSKLLSMGESTAAAALELRSDVLPLTFQCVVELDEPGIAIRRHDSQPRTWLI